MKKIIFCLLLTVFMATSCRTAIETPQSEAAPRQKIEVTWHEAKRHLKEEPVKWVMLAHSYRLFYELRGKEYVTNVPDFNESDWVWKTMARRRESGEKIDFIVE